MKPLPEIVSIKERVENELLNRPGVTGVDVGYKYVGGQRTEQLSIRVLVAKKRKNVSKEEAIPAEIEGIPTDVIERRFELHQFHARRPVAEVELMADTTKYSTLKGGIGIGPCRAVGGYVYVGTLGAIVKDKTTNQPMMLSNFHVMCIDNTWAVGNTMAQPSRVDGGSCPTDVVGQLQRAALTSKVDGAVASISGRPYECTIQDIGPVTGTATASLNTAVRKRGRTTALTHGTIDSISLSVTVDYGTGIGNKTLTGQIGILPDTTKNPKFGDHGDSGSVVVDGSGKVLGLYFAGDSTGYGVANPIADVLTALNVTLCTSPVKSLLLDHKATVKDVIIDKSLRKELFKEIKIEKIEVKEHSKSEFELPKTLEGPIGQIPNNPAIPQPGGVHGAPSDAQAGGTPPLKKVEIKEIKEPKEFKELKERKEKPEIKEQWKEKIEIKDVKPELKDHKPELKDHKELKREIKEHIKEIKYEKLEQKEHSKSEFEVPGGIPQLPGGGLHAGAQAYDPSAGNALTKLADSHKIVETTHKPLKDFKDAKIEWKEQKPERKESKDLKDHVEVYQSWPHIPIPDPGPYNPGNIAIGQLSPFISSDLRPDLTCGALRQETDLQGVDFASLSTQLQKEAANAMQAKVEFDTQQPQG